MSGIRGQDDAFPVFNLAFLGQDCRWAVDGRTRPPTTYILYGDYRQAVSYYCKNRSPFSDLLNDYMANRLERHPCRMADGRVVVLEVLSRRNVLDVTAQLPNELGARVRGMLLDAVERLERLYYDKLAAVEHFVEGAIDDGHSPEDVVARARATAATKVCGGVIKSILEDAGHYADKKFRGSVYAAKNERVNRAASGKSTAVVKAESGTSNARDAFVGLQLALTAIAEYGSASVLGKWREQIVDEFSTQGKRRGKAAIEGCVDQACAPVDQARQQYEQMGLI